MTCDAVREKLLELPPDKLGSLDGHLQGCASCRALVARIRAAEAAIGEELDSFESEVGFAEAWKVAQQDDDEPRATDLPRSLHAVAAAVAVAAVFLLAVTPRLGETPVAADASPTEQVERLEHELDLARRRAELDARELEIAQREARVAEEELAALRRETVAPLARTLPTRPPSIEPPPLAQTNPTAPEVADANEPVASPDCGPLAALQPEASLGALDRDTVTCLEARLIGTDVRMTERDRISRVLMVHAERGGPGATWPERVRYHLENIDASDPDLATKYALHQSKRGPAGARSVIHWAEVALENRNRWSGDEFVARVNALHRLRTLAAQSLWEHAEQEYAGAPGPRGPARIEDARTSTRSHAQDWLDFARAAGLDASLPASLCAQARGASCE